MSDPKPQALVDNAFLRAALDDLLDLNLKQAAVINRLRCLADQTQVIQNSDYRLYIDSLISGSNG